MKTYHIHISGQVQGVGFRPYAYQLAKKMGVKGWVSNSNDGVHIEFSLEENMAAEFYHALVQTPPAHSIISSHHMHEIPLREFLSFSIRESTRTSKPKLLLTPDMAICKECTREALENNNRWYHYPFTTCLDCGPRYSIINSLPYDRANTSMAPFHLCDQCTAEFNDVHDRRFYSQTISCPDCAIPLHLFDASGDELRGDHSMLLSKVNELLIEGRIIAVKGMGGYLLLCDATNENSIATLRQRKHRPQKPLALLYPDVATIQSDTIAGPAELEALQDHVAPIVLCRHKETTGNPLCAELIAPGLEKIGVMLPCTALLLLIAKTFKKPLVATSGNISGSPIIYKDNDALVSLKDIADYILTYEREIVIPEDDSLVQFTPAQQKIILRRSRGLAPTYYPNSFNTGETLLAMGGELKSGFALTHQQNLYVSQFLGDQEGVESQDAYTRTLHHLLQTLEAKPQKILLDKHPNYFVSQLGKEKAAAENIPAIAIQHHEAHFGAVLAENNLLKSGEPVLGVVWDGTGYGDDGQIWGGEFFIYEDGEINRLAHLDYFPQLLGDKMSREPRLSALSLLKNFSNKQDLLQKHFSEQEWEFYQKQLSQPGQLLTSSMGRLLDGIASLLGVCQLNSYEGEAAMKLEALASRHRLDDFEYYPVSFVNNRLEHNTMLPYIFEDLEQKADVAAIAHKLFCSLAKCVEIVSRHFDVNRIAFSGGVFQNELLVQLVTQLLAGKKDMYFHRQLSPNDECIGFGQIACYEIMKMKQSTYHQLSALYEG